jgi:hypothetical protein
MVAQAAEKRYPRLAFESDFVRLKARLQELKTGVLALPEGPLVIDDDRSAIEAHLESIVGAAHYANHLLPNVALPRYFAKAADFVADSDNQFRDRVLPLWQELEAFDYEQMIRDAR